MDNPALVNAGLEGYYAVQNRVKGGVASSSGAPAVFRICSNLGYNRIGVAFVTGWCTGLAFKKHLAFVHPQVAWVCEVVVLQGLLGRVLILIARLWVGGNGLWLNRCKV